MPHYSSQHFPPAQVSELKPQQTPAMFEIGRGSRRNAVHIHSIKPEESLLSTSPISTLWISVEESLRSLGLLRHSLISSSWDSSWNKGFEQIADKHWITRAKTWETPVLPKPPAPLAVSVNDLLQVHCLVHKSSQVITAARVRNFCCKHCNLCKSLQSRHCTSVQLIAKICLKSPKTLTHPDRIKTLETSSSNGTKQHLRRKPSTKQPSVCDPRCSRISCATRSPTATAKSCQSEIRGTNPTWTNMDPEWHRICSQAKTTHYGTIAIRCHSLLCPVVEKDYTNLQVQTVQNSFCGLSTNSWFKMDSNKVASPR